MMVLMTGFVIPCLHISHLGGHQNNYPPLGYFIKKSRTMIEPVKNIWNHGSTAFSESAESPVVLGREFNRAVHRRFGRRRYNPDGIDVFDRDWDNLIILDACRYDLFSETTALDGTLTAVESRGSNTVEFLRGNVASRDLTDTVYITGNPQLYNHREALDPKFHAIHDVWQDRGWDDEHRTVLPDVLTSEALDRVPDYPNKRLIVHFVQPHMPFIDSDTVFDKEMFGTSEDPWNWILKGEVDADRDEMWDAFAQNLEVAMPHVETLIEKLDGKTVVTADHGQCIGDRSWPVPIREWGHPWGMYIEPLVKVPWLECPSDERRTIESDPPERSQDDVEDDVVQERLEDLGYVS